MDKGNWSIFYDNDTRQAIGVCSGDFKHDVLLRVSGDFESDEQRKDYCSWLVYKLNKDLTP